MNQYDLLRNYYGYDSFREGQEEAINSILEGLDTFGIMPTGAGKSICYQIPALMLDGITLVVSPLISLMKDQVRTLNQMGIHAAFLNSSLTYNQYLKALEYAKQERYKIIYVAPERLQTGEFLSFAMHANISMVCVDEVHCVSQWGQDFRPSYLKIIEFVQMLPKRPILSAFTATATKEVRDDVVKLLKLYHPTIVMTGFDRKNLFFQVKTPHDKSKELVKYLDQNTDKSGIIYCSTRKNVEEVCDMLLAKGYLATRYHAGLSEVERNQNQDDFIYDRYPIMVATNAFGMGIDKSNVRFIVHYNMPKNMESYYQEAGRAGRDGESSECVLYYSARDVSTNQYFIETDRDNEELTEELLKIVRLKDRERLRKMTYYCFTKNCLREYMLDYFGEIAPNDCGNCANCTMEFEILDVTDICKHIIGCVNQTKQRYGVSMIVDILRGSKTERIRKFGMNKCSYYGIDSFVSIERLKQIINQLLLEEFLIATDDEFPILQLTHTSDDVVCDSVKVNLKIEKATAGLERRKFEMRRNGGAGGSTGQDTLSAGNYRYSAGGVGFAVDDTYALGDASGNSSWDQVGGNLAGSYSGGSLLDQLKRVRMEISKEEKVPPYIIFADKTLTQMCQYQPRTKEEMLQISGVGRVKYEKYGERFLEVLKVN